MLHVLLHVALDQTAADKGSTHRACDVPSSSVRCWSGLWASILVMHVALDLMAAGDESTIHTHNLRGTLHFGRRLLRVQCDDGPATCWKLQERL